MSIQKYKPWNRGYRGYFDKWWVFNKFLRSEKDSDFNGEFNKNWKIYWYILGWNQVIYVDSVLIWLKYESEKSLYFDKLDVSSWMF